MGAEYGAVLARRIDRNLEFARQKGEFGMKGRPLAQDFAIRTRIDQFIGGDTGKAIGCDVADAVPGSLDGVHFDAGEFAQNVRRGLEFRPVELHVVTCREMAVGAVVAAREIGELSELRGRELTIRNGDAQHRSVTLDVQAVLQT